MFRTELILSTFNPEKQIVIETDALDYALEVYLNQKDDNRNL